MKFFIIGPAHHKNQESIRSTLQCVGVEFKETNNSLDGLDESYDVVICFSHFFPPEAFPKNVKVLYGPHLFVLPENPHHPMHSYIYEEGRFFFNVLSPWVKACYEEYYPPPMKMITAPFGINTEAIAPVGTVESRSRILVYFKGTHRERYNCVINHFQGLGIPYNVFEYGRYKEDEYKQSLKNTKFVVWIGIHESQGFALQECLASNVPILLWDAQTMYDEVSNGRVIYEQHMQSGKKLMATSAPYWSDECGIRIREKDEFVAAFRHMGEMLSTFQPRAFIERELSLRVCFENLLTHIGLKHESNPCSKYPHNSEDQPDQTIAPVQSPSLPLPTNTPTN
jgi:hypothetical protein